MPDRGVTVDERPVFPKRHIPRGKRLPTLRIVTGLWLKYQDAPRFEGNCGVDFAGRRSGPVADIVVPGPFQVDGCGDQQCRAQQDGAADAAVFLDEGGPRGDETEQRKAEVIDEIAGRLLPADEETEQP